MEENNIIEILEKACICETLIGNELENCGCLTILEVLENTKNKQ
jgi:hypothetical protein